MNCDSCEPQGCVKEECKPIKLICKKCKENKPYIMLDKDPTCKNCFQVYMEHAFRMTLRMKCNVTVNNKGERILLCLSTGQNSLVLSKLFSDSIFQTGVRNKNKMFLSAEVLHIDESLIWNNLGIDVSQQEMQLQQYVENTCNFKYHVRKINSLYDQQHENCLLDLLQQLPDHGSAREDMIQYMRYHIILQFANENGFQKIAFGVNGQKMVSKLFSSLAKGRGIMMNSDISYENRIRYEQESPEFHIIRPLRDILDKSILYYIHLMKIEKQVDFNLEQHLSIQNKDMSLNQKPSKGNIDHLLDDFINKLQGGFCSTVFTALQTAGKTEIEIQNKDLFCPICLNNKDRVVNILETQTLDLSTQTHLQKLQEEAQFLEIICLACRRILINSPVSVDLLNLHPKYFPLHINNMGKVGLQKYLQLQH